MTILLLTQVFPPQQGGSGRWLWELYRRLSGIDVQVVAGHAKGAAAFDQSAEIRISRLALDFSSWGLLDWRGATEYGRAFLALRRIVSRVRPDAIHAGKCLPEGLLASMLGRWFGIPFYCFVHGEELTLAKTSKELRRLSMRVLHGAGIVIANSHHTKGLLTADWGLPEDRVVVMHPGVDTTRFVPAPASPAVRQRLGWTNRRVVLTVGALQKRKGQDMLIRALPAIRAKCPDVLYSIVGEGWEREYLEGVAAEARVQDLVQFRTAASDEDLIEHYQQCDVFALPNRRVGWDFEGFGIVLLEAQACGKPVIAGQSGGAPETVLASETGEVVDCEAPDALAEVVTTLLEDAARRAAMGERGRQRVVALFDWKPLTQQAAELFRANQQPTKA